MISSVQISLFKDATNSFQYESYGGVPQLVCKDCQNKEEDRERQQYLKVNKLRTSNCSN